MSSEDMLLETVLKREIEKLELSYKEVPTKYSLKIFSELLHLYLDYKFNKNEQSGKNNGNLGEDRN